ncbi:hypothetical protein FXN61_00390 [Lentzea sp. PSKA42]|uniref:Uncharacterized protein n=1 Tax=Lentzea indica TaxID=2604800 RepID=A0ABX1F8Z4_9PSEU|nr:hypothetical protein [Lentzea indica]NKE55365.1 hypothetical protein [Lentzea indica]
MATNAQVIAKGGLGGADLDWRLVREVASFRAAVIGTAPSFVQEMDLAKRLSEVWRRGSKKNQWREQRTAINSQAAYRQLQSSPNLASEMLKKHRNVWLSFRQGHNREQVNPDWPVLDQWAFDLEKDASSFVAFTPVRLSRHAARVYIEAGISCGWHYVDGALSFPTSKDIDAVLGWVTQAWQELPAGDEPLPEAVPFWWHRVRNENVGYQPDFSRSAVLFTIARNFAVGVAERERERAAQRQASVSARATVNFEKTRQSAGGYSRPPWRPMNWDLTYPANTWAPGTGPGH